MDAKPEQRRDGGGLQIGPSCAAGCALPKWRSVVWAAAPKPKCCGSRKPYGSVRDSVWELELGLQAKAATMALRWRVPGVQTIYPA